MTEEQLLYSSIDSDGSFPILEEHERVQQQQDKEWEELMAYEEDLAELNNRETQYLIDNDFY